MGISALSGLLDAVQKGFQKLDKRFGLLDGAEVGRRDGAQISVRASMSGAAKASYASRPQRKSSKMLVGHSKRESAGGLAIARTCCRSG